MQPTPSILQTHAVGLAPDRQAMTRIHSRSKQRGQEASASLTGSFRIQPKKTKLAMICLTQSGSDHAAVEVGFVGVISDCGNMSGQCDRLVTRRANSTRFWDRQSCSNAGFALSIRFDGVRCEVAVDLGLVGIRPATDCWGKRYELAARLLRRGRIEEKVVRWEKFILTVVLCSMYIHAILPSMQTRREPLSFAKDFVSSLAVSCQ
ncbi:uncharacterized protein BDV14DRAFT_91224 [Aspergillus stella-maris]|uniref:uncharacterized protein n=1 Tax=Aspergillus stella-maris TaxID=1810926 RepID=UPI003CCD0C39